MRAALASLSVAITTLPFLAIEHFPAGDLNSHVYNAWLVTVAREGRLPGIEVQSRWVNALADAWMQVLIRYVSPRATLVSTQVITASAFLWSAFLFARALSRRPCWDWLPLLACVSIGWTFHVGLTNWQLAASLSLAAAALALREPTRARNLLVAALILGVATRGNPLPALWAAGVVLLVVGLRRRVMAPWLLAASTIALVGLVSLAAEWVGVGEHVRPQLIGWTGADQLYVYDRKYMLFSLAVVALWLAVAGPWLWRARSAALEHPAFLVAVVTSACCLLVPDNVSFPGYAVRMTYIGLRSSTLAAVAWTAVAAGALATSTRRVAIVGSAIAAAWVLTLSQDWTRLSDAARNAESALLALPGEPRVVVVLSPGRARTDPFNHLIERLCIGRCFSWGNYEPSSGVLQIRALPGNAYVVSAIRDSIAIERGDYVVPPLPFPLWKMQACEGPGGTARVCVAQTTPGERLRPQCVDPFWKWGRHAPACPELVTRN